GTITGSAPAGASGLTVSGGGTLSLPATNSYTGVTTLVGGTATIVSGITVNSTGTLILGQNNSLPVATPLVLINGNIQASTAITLPNTPVTFGSTFATAN